MTWTKVNICMSSAPDAACDGDGFVRKIFSGDAASTAWVQVEPAPSGATSFVPVYAIPVGDVVVCKNRDGTFCPGDTAGLGVAQPSTLQFGQAAPFNAPFDVTQLNSAQMASAFAAGFVLIATGFVIGAPLRALLALIRGR